jgi:hypothetical protein
LVLAACGDTDDAAPAPTTDGADAAICGRFDRLVELGAEVRSPAVFNLSSEELQALYDERRTLTEEIIDLTDDADLQSELEDVNERRAIVEPVLLENLATNHDELEAIGHKWDIAIFNSSVPSSKEKAAYHGIDAGSWFSRLQILCLAPELADPLEEDLDGNVEGGTIIYKRLGEGEDRGLWAVPSSGGGGRAVDPPSGWDDLSMPSVAPDGSTLVALATRDTPPHQGIAVGTLDDGFAVIYESTDDVGLECLRWDRASGDVLASVFRFNEPSTVMRVAPSGETTPIETGSANLSCAEGLADGRLILSGSDEDVRGYGDVQVAERDDDGLEHLFGSSTCNEVIGPVDRPSGEQLLVFQSCDDPAERGMFIVDVESGAVTQTLTGLVATPAWSPSADWIVFGYAPLGSDSASTVRVWQMQPDGTGTRQLTDVPSSYPVWVSDEL